MAAKTVAITMLGSFSSSCPKIPVPIFMKKNKKKTNDKKTQKIEQQRMSSGEEEKNKTENGLHVTVFTVDTEFVFPEKVS